MTIDLDKLEQLARAATPGPYQYRDDTSAQHLGSTVENEARAIVAMHTSLEDAAYIAAANPAVVLELVQRLRAAEAIVRDLAECYRPVDSDYGTCSLCDANPCAPTCPYRRAVEAQ